MRKTDQLTKGQSQKSDRDLIEAILFLIFLAVGNMYCLKLEPQIQLGL